MSIPFSNATRYDYDPYGRRTKISGSYDADFGYTGHFHEQPGWMTTGLNLAWFRAYDPELGRWLSRDPVEDAELLPEGPNLYAYVGNDPVVWVDPDGQYVQIVVLGVELGELIGIGVLTLEALALTAELEEKAHQQQLDESRRREAAQAAKKKPCEPVVIPKGKGGKRAQATAAAATGGPPEDPNEHTKNARKSTGDKHAKGRARAKRDKKGGEDGDARRSF